MHNSTRDEEKRIQIEYAREAIFLLIMTLIVMGVLICF